MIKNTLLKEITDRIEGMTQKNVESVLSEFANIVTETLKNDNDEKITLPGLGTFSAKSVAPRDGVSPIDGKKWHTEAHTEIKFKISKNAKVL